MYQAYALKGQINPAQGNALGLRMPKENPPRSAILPPPCPSRVGGGLQSAVRRVRPFDPGCRSARWRRSTLGWVDLPLRGVSGTPIYSWNHSPHRIIRLVPRGFAPGYRPAALQAASGRIRPPNTLLFGGLVACELIHPLTQVAASHMG